MRRTVLGTAVILTIVLESVAARAEGGGVKHLHMYGILNPNTQKIIDEQPQLNGALDVFMRAVGISDPMHPYTVDDYVYNDSGVSGGVESSINNASVTAASGILTNYYCSGVDRVIVTTHSNGVVTAATSIRAFITSNDLPSCDSPRPSSHPMEIDVYSIQAAGKGYVADYIYDAITAVSNPPPVSSAIYVGEWRIMWNDGDPLTSGNHKMYWAGASSTTGQSWMFSRFKKKSWPDQFPVLYLGRQAGGPKHDGISGWRYYGQHYQSFNWYWWAGP